MKIRKFAAIAASSSGDNTLVPATPDTRIRVVAVWLIADGPVDAKFQSGASDITGLAYLPANGGMVLPENPGGWFETEAGEALELNLSSAVAVGGSLVYQEIA